MYLKIKDINVYYEEIGNGIPVIMLHGYTPDHRLMSGCMESVFEKMNGNYRRIYFDLPGMGKTKVTDSVRNSDDMLNIVIEFIEETVKEEKFILVGESYGGYLARGVTLRKREQILGISLICPLIVPDNESRDLPEKIVLDRDEQMLESLNRKEKYMLDLSGSAVYSRKVWEDFRKNILPALEIVDRKFINEFSANGYSFSFDVDDVEKPYEFPGLFLAGRQDSVVGYRDMWNVLENYPRASFIVLDKAGHNIQSEQNELFEETMKEWFTRIDDYSGKF